MSRQERGSRRRAEPAAAVRLAAGLYLVWKMAEGARWARIHNLQRGCITRCCRCSSVRRRRRRGWSAKQGGDGHSRTGDRGGGRLLCRTPGQMSRLCDERRCSQGFCGARAALDGYGKNRIENGVSGRRNRSAAGTAFGSGDGCRSTSDESPRGSRNAVNPYTWLVCEKIVKCGRGDREPTQGSMFSAGHEPTQDSALGVGHEPTQDSAFGERHESTQTDHWDRR